MRDPDSFGCEAVSRPNWYVVRCSNEVQLPKSTLAVVGRRARLCTCSNTPRREECYLYATGFTHALYIWRELAPVSCPYAVR
jgi:hypothetical protein